MTKKKFMHLILNECIKRSYKSFTFSKIQHDKFRWWFHSRCKKHYGMTKKESLAEFEKFKKAFNVTIKNSRLP